MIILAYFDRVVRFFCLDFIYFYSQKTLEFPLEFAKKL